MIQIFVCMFLCGMPALSTAAGALHQNVPTADDTCGISGIWANELNNTILIACTNGSLTGRYVHAAKEVYDFTGRYTMAGKNHQDVVLGWTISKNNHISSYKNYLRSWTGIYYANEGIIHTHWIMATYYERKEMWAAYMIGHEDFQKEFLN